MGEIELPVAPAVLERHPALTVRAFEAADLEAASGHALSPSDEAIGQQLDLEGLTPSTLSSETTGP